MKPKTDFLILGGGIIGLLTAHTLRKQGADLLLVDGAPRSASLVGAGILSPLPPWRYPPAIQRLAADGAAAYPKLIAELGDHCDYRQCGMAVLPPYDTQALSRWRTAANQLIDPADITPALRTEAHKAIHLPETARLSPPRLIRALRRTLRPWRLIDHCRQLTIESRSTAPRVTGAILKDRPDIKAKRVIITAGAWSPWHCPSPKPGIHPRRGQLLLYTPPPSFKLPTILLSEKNTHYALQRSDGQLLAGATLEDTGFDTEPNPAACQPLRRQIASWFPTLGEPEQIWVGLRPKSAHGYPIIDRHPTVKNLYLNTGHFRYGLTMAPAAANQLLTVIGGIADPGDFAYPVPDNFEDGLE